jgi:hypothetical protein
MTTATPTQETPATETPKAVEGAGTPAPKTEAKAAAPADAQASPKAEAPKEETPVVYDLKIPEGSLIDPAQVEKIASFAKERGLSSAHAQELLDRENEALSSFAQRQQEAYKQTQNGWITTIQNDKELGGAMMKENMELSKRVIDKYGSESLKQELISTGLGNHPELVRVFARIGREMSDDKLVIAGSHNSTKKSMEEIFYGPNNQ